MKYSTIVFLIFAALTFSACNKDKNTPVQKTTYQLKNTNSIPAFDYENAYRQVQMQVSFGPRNPGSAGHQKALDYFVSEFNKYTSNVELQSFTYPGYDNVTLNLTNVIARFNPKSSRRIFICAHWDSRPWADQDKDSTKRDQPIPGANDGASGVGILLEIARVLKDNNISYGVDLILFDGEDYGHQHDLMNYCLGSKYFASQKPENYNPEFGILLDLVGDKEAVFPKEANSVLYGSDVVDLLWDTARNLNAGCFSNNESQPIYDDHIPLNEAGIKAVDIVDVDLIGADTPNPRRNYWHTHNDNMDNIGKETLKQVGEVLIKFIYSLQFNTVNS